MKKFPVQVCYLSNFYDLNNHEKQADYIERKAFQYEPKNLKDIFEGFTNKVQILTSKNHDEIINIYLSLKHRNPCFRNFLKEFNIEPLIDSEIEELKKEKDLIEKIAKKSFEELMAKIKSGIISDKELPDRNHKNAIIQQSEGINTPINEVKEKLLHFQITILEPLNIEDYFITSDNPGFTILKDKIYNTNFGKFDAIGFPINSKQILVFSRKNGPLDKTPTVKYLKIPKNSIHIINQYSAITSMKYIFCEDREYLHKFTLKFQSSYADNN